MTEKEYIAAIKNKQRVRALEHRRKHQHDGLCSGLNDKEWMQVQTKMKTSNNTKASKHSFSKLWNHYNVKIDTL